MHVTTTLQRRRACMYETSHVIAICNTMSLVNNPKGLEKVCACAPATHSLFGTILVSTEPASADHARPVRRNQCPSKPQPLSDQKDWWHLLPSSSLRVLFLVPSVSQSQYHSCGALLQGSWIKRASANHHPSNTSLHPTPGPDTPEQRVRSRITPRLIFYSHAIPTTRAMKHMTS